MFNKKRLIITLSGCVQGVGFRPFVYRLARECALAGHIRNTSCGVAIDVEGESRALADFQRDLSEKKPKGALISEMRIEEAPFSNAPCFEIISSISHAKTELALLPDTAICLECLQELSDPQNRRYRYPFLHCMACGPRFSLFVRMPFDRQNTTMADFPMCHRCRSEYDDASDRRFYSQTNCCPECGPELMLFDQEQNLLASKQQAIDAAIEALGKGKILALKNTGGFLLLCDATDQAAVDRLRLRKQRKKKPFATLVPTLCDAAQVVCIDQIAASVLTSPAAPIVLLEKCNELAPSIAFESPYYGIMLAHNALQHLLLRAIKRPLVATSGNISGKPICIEEKDAFQQLKEVADVFLVHNRRIMHRLDDSVVHIINHRPMILRRARGYIPYAVEVSEKFRTSEGIAKLQFGAKSALFAQDPGSAQIAYSQSSMSICAETGPAQKSSNSASKASFAIPSSECILGAGGHLKNSFALAKGQKIYLSQYIGDLDSKDACEAYDQEVKSWESLLNTSVDRGVCDHHPDYHTSHYLQERNIPAVAVQHHRAHVYSGMLDNQLTPPFLSVSWDGTGLGDDRTIWGGEAFIATKKGIEHFAGLSPFRLPGGEKAIKEPRRCFLGVMYALFGANICSLNGFCQEELHVLIKALEKGINAPFCSSMGRLFDAVSALLECCLINHFEGEAALALEALANKAQRQSLNYTISLKKQKNIWLMEWQDMIKQMLIDKARGRDTSAMSLAFHVALSELVVQLAKKASLENVLLTGGCMQNKRLVETTVSLLKEAGFQPYWHQHIPPNDGGIAAGQVFGKMCEDNNVLSASG